MPQQMTLEKLDSLAAFQALTSGEQEACRRLYATAVSEQSSQHTYLKRTHEVAEQTGRLTGKAVFCFISFDTLRIGPDCTVLVFMLNGIFLHYSCVLYFNVMESRGDDKKLVRFIGEMLVNLLLYELPKLSNLRMEFIMCKRVAALIDAVYVMRHAKSTAPLLKQFHFVWEPLELKRELGYNKYAQEAVNYIVYSTLRRGDLELLLASCRERCSKSNTEQELILRFILDYVAICEELFRQVDELSLCNCNQLSLTEFFRALHGHVKRCSALDLTRALVFDYVRALVIIFGY